MVLRFETIEQRDASGSGRLYENRQPGLMVIETSEEAVNLDALVTPETRARLHNVNYNAYFVIAAFQGWKPTRQHGVQVERITRQGSEVTVYARFSEPKADEEKAPEVTSPYHLIQVRKVGTWGQRTTFNLVVGGATVTSLSHRVP